MKESPRGLMSPPGSRAGGDARAGDRSETEKGARWMPGLPEAMKDAASGETPRGSASAK